MWSDRRVGNHGILSDIIAVARRQHGRLLLCHRRSRYLRLPPRLCRLLPHHSVHQHARHHPRCLLLNIRSQVRPPANGPLTFLLRLLRRQGHCLFQRPRLHRLVVSKRHRWRTASAYGQPRHPWLCRGHHHCSGNVSHHPVWLQSRAYLRVLVVDPLFHRLFDRTRRIRTLGRLCQYPHVDRWA